MNRRLRVSWLELLREYTRDRSALRLVCHLVDSRHGLLPADEQCLSLIQHLPDNVRYAVILTKADKRGGEGRTYIVGDVKEKLRQYTAAEVPVVLCSSDTREGGSAIWSVMLDAFSADQGDSKPSSGDSKPSSGVSKN